METKTLILIIVIPIISAFIGWLTNYIAIKSLFRPNKQKKILGLKIQGLIPKRKKALASNISQVVEKYFFSSNDIVKELEKPQNIKKIKQKILPILQEKIEDKIPQMLKPIATPIIQKTLEKEIDNLILKINEEIANHAFETIDIKSIVQEKLQNYDTKKLEKIIYKIAKKELKHIELLGALIGFMVGISQIILIIVIN
jgi:uncharacterized membrane protein YheB (UPF0754 family)